MSVPTDEREALFARIAVELKLINGADPYTNKIKLVSRELMSPDQFPADAYPGVCMVEQSEGPEDKTTPRLITIDAGLMLLVAAQLPPPGTKPSTVINSLINDVLTRMLRVDNTHNGLCHFTQYTSGEPFTTIGSKVIWAAMVFRLRYTIDWAAP